MIEGMEQRIVVVGGGPTGLYCSYLIKKENPNLCVVLLEQHDKIGESICCGGHVAIDGLNKTNIPKLINLKNCIINKVRGANIFGPYNAKLKVKTNKYQTYVLDRIKFDNEIKELALKEGVEIRTNSKVKKIDGNFVIVSDLKNKKDYELRFAFLIGADGPNSIVRNSFENKPQTNSFINTYQVIVDNSSFDTDMVNVYFGNFAKNFFAWVIPLDESKIKIGIGTSLDKNVKDAFEDFYCTKLGLKLDKCNFDCSAVIPVSRPMKNYVQKNRLLVGDAACFVKATSGGGINFGLISSQIAATAITQRVKTFKSISSYNKLLKNCINELKLHYKIYRFVNTKTNVEIDELLLKLKSYDIEKFLETYGNIDFPTEFIPKMIRYPKLLLLYKEFFNFLKT